MTWEDEAEHWVRWARTPGHDGFTRYWPSFASEVLPAAPGRVLEVGCGEGRVVREMAALGYRVVGLDASPTLVRHARAASGNVASNLVTCAAGDATALPFADASFDTVVAYNSLQAMQAFEDMARAVGEAGRVLRAGGSLCMCVAHPMTDIGRLRIEADGAIAVTGSYFEREEVDDAVTKDGLEMRFHGWTYTLEDYARALEDAGCAMKRVREPQGEGARWGRLPLFLMLRAVRVA